MKQHIESKTLIRKQFEVEVKELSNGLLRAIVNSGKQDRYGEILDMTGLDTKVYMTNPILADGHDYSQPSVGRTEKLTKKDGALIADFLFATDIEGYAKPKILDQLYRKKYQFAFSIGFIPKEMEGNTYTKAEMIEFSPVLIGADAQALLKGLEKENSKFINKSVKKINNLSKKTMKKTIKKISMKKAKELLEAQRLELEKSFSDQIKALEIKLDKPKKGKNIKTQKGEPKDYSKEEILKSWVIAMSTRDFSEYREVLKSAGNTTDDSALLPPTEFVAEVLRLEETYGIAKQFCKIKQTNRTSITGIKGADDVVIYETAEAGVKKSTKTGYEPWEMTFRKFAAIAPITDELLEDSAVDVWNDLTNRFARAYAKKEDQLVFTDSTSGIVNDTDVVEQVIDGDSIEDITFDDINKAIYAVPTPSMNNGRFYLNRTILGVIQRLKDNDGNYIWKNGPNGPLSGTIWNMPYSLVEILPSLVEDAEDTAFIIFGDLKNTLLGARNQMKAKIFDAGVVADPDDEEEDLNLVTQDMQAMRVVKRMNAKTLFGDAYCVIKTGTSTS